MDEMVITLNERKLCYCTYGIPGLVHDPMIIILSMMFDDEVAISK